MAHLSLSILERLLNSDGDGSVADWAAFRDHIWTMQVRVPGRKTGSTTADGDMTVMMTREHDGGPAHLIVSIVEGGNNVEADSSDNLISDFPSVVRAAEFYQIDVTLEDGEYGMTLLREDLLCLRAGLMGSAIHFPMSADEARICWRHSPLCAVA